MEERTAVSQGRERKHHSDQYLIQCKNPRIRSDSFKNLGMYDHDDHEQPKLHPHDENGGHYHDWEWSKERPRQDPYFKGGLVLGIGLLTVSSLRMAVVTLDDATGIGIGDDFLYGPLSAGLVMIWEVFK